MIYGRTLLCGLTPHLIVIHVLDGRQSRQGTVSLAAPNAGGEVRPRSFHRSEELKAGPLARENYPDQHRARPTASRPRCGKSHCRSSTLSLRDPTLPRRNLCSCEWLLRQNLCNAEFCVSTLHSNLTYPVIVAKVGLRLLGRQISGVCILLWNFLVVKASLGVHSGVEKARYLCIQRNLRGSEGGDVGSSSGVR